MNRSIAGLLLICLVASANAAPDIARVADVAVVVNLNNPMTTLSIGELRKIFAGERRTWPGGSSIKLIVRMPGTHERLVLMKLLGMSEGDYKQYWTSQVFRGEATSEPVAVFSNGMVKEAVVGIPGAIALMEARDVKPGIKVIRVEGLLPGSPDYPLH
jgi:ABC-type phosphate transport system substrate-binding protein